MTTSQADINTNPNGGTTSTSATATIGGNSNIGVVNNCVDDSVKGSSGVGGVGTTAALANKLPKTIINNSSSNNGASIANSGEYFKNVISQKKKICTYLKQFKSEARLPGIFCTENP